MSEIVPSWSVEHHDQGLLQADSGNNAIGSLHGGDWYTPLSSRAIFWRPHYLDESPFLQHLPLLFWLIEVQRPGLAMQVRLGEGVAYLGLCQAVEKLDLGTTCIGVAAKGEDIPPTLRAHHDNRYADFSRLLSGGLNEARYEPVVGIDLFILNLPTGEDDADLLITEVLPLLSERAVLILCYPPGGESPAISALPRERNPALIFQGLNQSCDVEIILHGKQQPDQLRQLALQFPGVPGYLSIRQVINRLGLGPKYEQQVRAGSIAQEQGEARLAAAQSEVLLAREEIQAALAAEAASLDVQSNLQVRIHDLVCEGKEKSGKIDELRDELSKVTADLVVAQQKRSGHWARVEELTAAHESLQANHAAREQEFLSRIAELETNHDARIMDIAALQEAHERQLATMRQNEQSLRANLEEAQAKRSGHWKKVEALTQNVTLQRQDLEAKGLRIAELEQNQSALLSSTSWRVTKPLRSVLRAFSRRKGKDFR